MAHSTAVTKNISTIHRIAFALLFTSLIAGQLIRFVIPGQGGGLLFSDIAAVLLLAVAVISPSPVLGEGEGEGRASAVLALLAVSPFLLWSIAMLIFRSGIWGYEHLAVALLYWARLASILLLYPAGVMILRTENMKRYAKKAFIFTYIALLFAGFFQLLFFPSLEGLSGGWDPHINRMVGTWLDPNFFGAFLALSLPPVLYWLHASNQRTLAWMRVLVFILGSFAIVLTKSRSTYLATAIALCVCAIVWLVSSSIAPKWQKFVIPGVGIGSVLIVCSLFFLQERATQIFSHDPTVALRLEAYRVVWDRLVEPNFFFGVGYNAYQVAAKDAGIITDFSIHSRSGSDSSILTLLVTTGIIGTALFAIPLVFGFIKHYSLLFVWATVFLLVHSQFENSLLYAHLLMPYIFIVLLAL